MTQELKFDRSEPEGVGHARQVSPLITRLVAPNPGPFTFTGTCTYLLGDDPLIVIDPGPADDQHWQALLEAIGHRSVSHILVTHTHKDHSPLARRLAEYTGAEMFGAAPHKAARALNEGEVNLLDASADYDHKPDRILQDGEILRIAGLTIEVVATPGHTMNHLAFALKDDHALFSGDHVMAWSTSIVAPPDGAMSAYMQSLEKLLPRNETIYWPGHGGPVIEPYHFVQGLIAHRKSREASILAALSANPVRIPDLVSAIYIGLSDQLKGAAALSIFAHLEDLVARHLVATDGEPTLSGLYRHL
jgi:glyoxylase-like metal-dependent hydrolase (beta-lactamase superfamily II)